MNKFCTNPPEDKKEFISGIGRVLVDNHGQKPFYKPIQIKHAVKKYVKTSALDSTCWAIAIFANKEDFHNYHLDHDEVCDYNLMRAEMLNPFGTTNVEDWIDIPNLNLESSWLDFGENFEGAGEGISDFISSIID